VDCKIICLRREEADVRSPATWRRILDGVDVVFHFAAQTSIPLAEKDPPADYTINALPLLHLAETCREMGLSPDVLFTGTVTETGIPMRLPVDETHPDHPVTIYDLHKWLAEQYLKHFVKRGILRGAILRLANVYGPGPQTQSPDRGVLNQMIRKALAGETLAIYDPLGDKLRDYIFVEDAALAFLKAGAYMEEVNGRHFVIGSGEGHTIAEAFHLVADQISLITGREVEVRHSPPPSPPSPIEMRNFVADFHSFSKITGWIPQTSLKEGIAKTIRAFL